MHISKDCEYGEGPAIVLDNPKFSRNVSAVVRLASAFGFPQVWFSGNRVMLDLESKDRLPREERMKGYGSVELINNDYPFDAFKGYPIIGVELTESATPISYLEHEPYSVYVFGPEDGSICKTYRSFCHQIVYIPVKHCLNLATTVSAVMMHRMDKLGDHFDLDEPRGFGNFEVHGMDGTTGIG
jgi:tRNA(Leu) C34 or U34 (ribose-2'-O)-methylase TrmL